MSDTPGQFAEFIQHRMELCGMDKQELARRSKISYEYIRQIVNEGRIPAEKGLLALAETLEVSFEELRMLAVYEKNREEFEKLYTRTRQHSRDGSEPGGPGPGELAAQSLQESLAEAAQPDLTRYPVLTEMDVWLRFREKKVLSSGGEGAYFLGWYPDVEGAYILQVTREDLSPEIRPDDLVLAVPGAAPQHGDLVLAIGPAGVRLGRVSLVAIPGQGTLYLVQPSRPALEAAHFREDELGSLHRLDRIVERKLGASAS